MNGELTCVKLFGILGKKYGKVWHLANADTPRKACMAIGHLKPGFVQDVLAVKGAFRVRVGGRKLGERHVDFSTHGKTIHITPLYAGAAGKALAIGEAILGVVLIVVGALLSFAGIGVPIALLGVSLLLGGVAGLLSPIPNLDSKDNNKNARRPSYQFNGPTNTVAQGSPHPIAYGKPITGSAVGSAGIYNIDITDADASRDSAAGRGAGPIYTNLRPKPF